ncbi:protein Simiate-like [Durio zibethinus]|uniref:Protein Simiate-like n=1 Tax=Durio zibethinus TaxID=66656 RepID=A0A6P6AM96_DURZI|nr:protein Simiate-like [Durio zibethinus]
MITSNLDFGLCGLNKNSGLLENRSVTEYKKSSSDEIARPKIQTGRNNCYRFYEARERPVCLSPCQWICVVRLAPTHVALKDKGGITTVDFNVGKSDCSGMKVTGKGKKNAQHFEPNTALCKVFTSGDSFIVRCCVKGFLLEANNRLIKQPELLNSSAHREGYIAIIMPKPADWLKFKASLRRLEEFKKMRSPC